MFKLLICFFTFSIIAQDIQIIVPQKELFHDIMSIDQKITYEFFKPQFQNSYPETSMAKEVDNFLAQDLADDFTKFSEVFKNNQQDKFLRVAFDYSKNIVIGLNHFHFKDSKNIEIDLLLVDKSYRGFGIGRRLIYDLIFSFPELENIYLFTSKANNEYAINFYKSLGFEISQATDDFDYLVYKDVKASKIFYLMHLKKDNFNKLLKRSLLQFEQDFMFRK